MGRSPDSTWRRRILSMTRLWLCLVGMVSRAISGKVRSSPCPHHGLCLSLIPHHHRFGVEIALRRLFQRGDKAPAFGYGGRYYASVVTGDRSWQQLSKAQRKTITIDGKRTAELDYKGLHLRMLYQCFANQLAAFIPNDPYEMSYTNGGYELWRFRV